MYDCMMSRLHIASLPGDCCRIQRVLFQGCMLSAGLLHDPIGMTVAQLVYIRSLTWPVSPHVIVQQPLEIHSVMK